MTVENPLVLRFDPQTVDHLGARMYSHLPNALAELVANAYDADASRVLVSLDSVDEIRVIDDGHGMSRSDVADKYLRIGRNRRKATHSTLTESGARRVSGKKGLGKLALFGIGRVVNLVTSRAGEDHSTEVLLSYDEMMAAEGDYRPRERTLPADAASHGTSVTLGSLKRKTRIDPKLLSEGLARLFAYTDADFSITVRAESGEQFPVDESTRIGLIDAEFSWRFPEDFIESDEFLTSRGVTGRIVSARKPLRQTQRGVTLYAYGRMVNEPEFFGSAESSYAFSYLSGHLAIDFIDDGEVDFIATDRRAIDWENELTGELSVALRALLTRLSQEWRVRRNEARRAERDEQVGEPTERWIASIKPREERDAVERIITRIEALDLTPGEEGALLQDVSVIAPVNAEYVWRHLHPEIQAATRAYYDSADYFQAVQEAIKRYVSLARERAGLDVHGALGVVTGAFGQNAKLAVFARYQAIYPFTSTSVKDIEEGQKHLSMGVIAGFRNPLAHEEIEQLQQSGAFTFQDCLDALSIISHLTRRLNDAELRST